MYPIKFEPIYKECIWGGANLRTVFGRDFPSDHIGESWDLSSHTNGTSIVSNGHLAGQSLNQLLAQSWKDIMGKKIPQEKQFPLLVKIIDANDNLSIQVHPGDGSCEVEDEGGKTEAWYVVSAKENAQLVYGLQKGMTKEKFIKAVAENTVGDAVRRVTVKAGDMIFVPAGTVHALLDGVMVYEVQQNSDITYRIYDYGRVDQDGKLRELHITKALEAINFETQLSDAFENDQICCPYFSMEKLIVSGEKQEKTADQFIIYCVIAGQGEIQYQEARERLELGDTVLIPACLGEINLIGNLTLLKIT